LWISYLAQYRLPVRIIAGILVALTLIFIVFFLIRGILVRLKLWRLKIRLRKVTAATADFTKIFSLDRALAHLWREYRHTLHEQKEVNPATGLQELVELRATVPAETFFNAQTIIDNRLRTEFFKHLPGICTGLGIIGTFLGLLQGLAAFKVSENAQEVRLSLEALLHGVFEAFSVSAVAIALAMAITLAEKFLIASLYRATDSLANRLDSMFEAGAGAEYLERLVKASEESASQAKILKDAIITDLKEILSDLTQKQISATSAGTAQLGQQIIAGLQAGFTGPLAQIAGAVERVSLDQGQAVTKLLTDVLAGFSQRIQDLFGGQLTGINQLQQSAVEALNSAVAKLDQMSNGMDAASQRATESLAGKIGEAIDAMQLRLEAVNNRTKELVDQMGSSTTGTIDKMNSGADTLHAAVGNFTKATQGMTDLMSGAAQSSDALTQSARSMTAATSVLEAIVADYRASRDTFERMLTELRATVENAKKEASLTSDVLTRMNDAAEKLSQAQTQAGDYLETISGVLAETHQEFSDNMRKTLGEANRQFYDQLTQGTQLLRAAIQELEVTLSSIQPPE
jgi:ABC-type transporter Mla subunit MlaD